MDMYSEQERIAIEKFRASVNVDVLAQFSLQEQETILCYLERCLHHETDPRRQAGTC